MAAKSTGYCGKILAALFTSVVAPLLVHLVEQNLPVETLVSNIEKLTPWIGADAPRQSTPSLSLLEHRSPRATPTSQGDEIVRVIAHGVGRTPDASLQDALRTALRQAILAHNEVIGAAGLDRNISESLNHEAGDFILGWQEIETRTEWEPTGFVYHKRVTVTVNGRALADRLRSLFFSASSNRLQTRLLH